MTSCCHVSQPHRMGGVFWERRCGHFSRRKVNGKGSEHVISRDLWSEEGGDLEGHKAKEKDEMVHCTS